MRVSELEGLIETSHNTRPTKEFVCAQWAGMMELWDKGDEAERTEMMQVAVRRVVMVEKEKGTRDLAVMPQVPSRWLTITEQMGAGNTDTYTIVNPRVKRVPLFVPSGGRNRMKVSRPERRTVTENAV